MAARKQLCGRGEPESQGNMMKSGRLYADEMYRFEEPQPSYWEALEGGKESIGVPLTDSQSCDVAIIGGGYTGLSAALHLARDYSLDVRVLEAGHIGWGASGRNAGFCCIGATLLDIDQQVRQVGLEETRRYYRAQVEAVELVRQLGVDESIDLQIVGDAELDVAHSKAAFEHLQAHAETQRKVLGLDTRVYTAAEFRERFFDSTEQFGAAQTRPTFALNPLRFARGLAAAALRRGALLHPHSEVIRWQKDGEWHVLQTAQGSLRARRVILATNGFAAENLSMELAGRPLPLISAMLVTRPLTDAELAAQRWQCAQPAVSSRILLNYFRMLPDRRFVFGGRGVSRGDPKGAKKTFDLIQRRLGEIWPAWRDIEIDYRWHGFVCFTRDRKPAIGVMESDPSVFYGFGYHGNGVNTATWTGRQLAIWLGSSQSGDSGIPHSIPALMRGMPRRFPMPGLRRRYLQGALAWYRFVDWLS